MDCHRISIRAVTRAEAVEFLRGGVWHTTSLQRYAQIRVDCKIKTAPEISDAERWKTAAGPEHYPFVRHISGVSLFDFRAFDPEEYSAKYALSSWETFVPNDVRHGPAVWIEIDIAVLGEAFVSGQRLVEMWKEQNAYGHTIMPHIEAASLIDIRDIAFRRVVCLSRKVNE